VEHLTPKQIGDYSQSRLSAAELLAASDHLAECELCRSSLEATTNGDAAFFAVHAETFAEETTVHLTLEQTSDYVDRHLSGEALQMVQDHLGNCEPCAFAVADLRDFRNEIAPSLDREYRPAAAPVHAHPPQGRSFWKLFRISPVPAFGAAALVLLLFGVIGYLVWRTPERREEIAVVPSPSPIPSPSVQPTVAPPPQVTYVAQLTDGSGVVSLDQEGNLAGADSLPPAYQSLVKKALSSQRVERSTQLEGLARPQSSLMGSDSQGHEFSILEPVGSVLMTDRPAFRWSNLEGATGYVVEVYDQQFNLVATGPQQSGNAWSITLPRGNVYSWQVKAIKDGQEITSPRPPAPQAKFRVLDQAKANEIANAKRAYGTSHLTLGLLYADAGLLREAEQEFRLLRRANPNSDIARNLLRQIQALRARSN
jgi:anti-sigma factor RsiW